MRAYQLRQCSLGQRLAIERSADGMAGGQMLDLMADELAQSEAGFGVQQTEQMQQMKTGACIAALLWAVLRRKAPPL